MTVERTLPTRIQIVEVGGIEEVDARAQEADRLDRMRNLRLVLAMQGLIAMVRNGDLVIDEGTLQLFI